MGIKAYEFKEQFYSGRLRYYFESVGRANIEKAIEYAPLGSWSGRDVYNLGFGDYDVQADGIIDSTISNNNDHRAVFATVLESIPAFFKKFPAALVFVQGSDSSDEFIEECRKTCTRKCIENECRKAGRRIAIYRGYVDDNFDELAKAYKFWGVLKHSDTPEDYKVGKQYEVILVHKK